MMRVSRRTFVSHCAAAAGLGLTGLAWSQEPKKSARQETEKDSSKSQIVIPPDQVIKRGLVWLASRQQKDGAFGTFGSSEYSRNVAVVALAGLAFMSQGSTPGRGPYGKNVDQCIDYILANTQEDGFIAVSGASSHGPMYGHGFATMFLAETYGMSMRLDLREKLSKALALIVVSQNKDGGWRYQPKRSDADISVTSCQIMALRAARNAGLNVPRGTVERCIEYVKRCQNADGGFMYMIHGGDSLFPRSAAGVVALYSAGIHDIPKGIEVKKGIKYLMRYLPKKNLIRRQSHYFYGHYYAVQAMWHAGGKDWSIWYPAIREALVDRQSKNGSWADPICREYGTAMACIILQMPNSYLPIFQR